MSFARYPTYKDSGVEWLGEVPGHWGVAPVKNLATIVNGYPFDSAQFDPAQGAPLIRIRDLNKSDSDTFFKGQFVEAAAVTADDVLIGMDGDFNVGRWRGVGRALLNQRMCCVRGNTMLLTRLLEYCLPARLKAINDLTYATTVKHLSSSQVERSLVAVPPEDEQHYILAFLDRETAKIDALVAEQQRLIELLKEKRQAVISHAVTKGLNPDAPMKDSGIEWLGAVPAHWEVKRLKFLLSGTKAGPFGSALTKDMYVTKGFRVYGQEQVIPSDFSIGDYYITAERFAELRQYSVSPGDVLISCVGTFGKIAIVPMGIEPGIINPRLIRLRCAGGVHDGYLVDVLRSTVTFEQFSATTRGGTMDVINIGTLSGIWVALPPPSEQRAIRNHLYEASAKFDTLTAEAQRAIDLLQERRTALISAAVTGQIDVRPASERASA